MRPVLPDFISARLVWGAAQELGYGRRCLRVRTYPRRRWLMNMPGVAEVEPMTVIVDCGAPETGQTASEAHAQGRGYGRMRSQRNTGRSGEAEAPIDLVHLRRFTLGDRTLELEVLGLFAGEAPVTLARARAVAAISPVVMQEWRNACHTLKGSARAVGAQRLAAVAEAAEKETAASTCVLAAHIAAMSAAATEVCAYIDGLR